MLGRQLVYRAEIIYYYSLSFSEFIIFSSWSSTLAHPHLDEDCYYECFFSLFLNLLIDCYQQVYILCILVLRQYLQYLYNYTIVLILSMYNQKHKDKGCIYIYLYSIQEYSYIYIYIYSTPLAYLYIFTTILVSIMQCFSMVCARGTL